MRSLAVLLIMTTATWAQAQIVFAPSITYSSTEIESPGGTTDSDSMVIDLKVGYQHASGLILGANYSMNNMALFNDDDSGFSLGPMVGFSHYNGFYALFSYFIMGEFEQGNSTTTLTEGMGPQVDIGWVFPITSSFSLGPQITYKSITYDTIESAGVETTQENTITEINPFITLWFRF